ncbi:MAG: zinc-ribbon domain-containing protein, partial [Thiobacillus sp.]|nr:zinc-ribbon domain-containing protein [Thiobacillus sp.]
MNYRAACPHCASVFRLGDDQLAAAAGWVQCGVCGAAFDARLSLCMEDGSALPVA